MINVISLIIWLFVAVIYFSKPKEHSSPNWFVGLIAVNFMLINILRLLGIK